MKPLVVFLPAGKSPFGGFGRVSRNAGTCWFLLISCRCRPIDWKRKPELDSASFLAGTVVTGGYGRLGGGCGFEGGYVDRRCDRTFDWYFP